MLQSMMDSKQSKNAGFTLVELIVCVSILAIAAIPIIKSLGMSSRLNAKAQSIQNANSLGEAIMEEMKSSTIDELRTKYGSAFTESGGDYQITIPNKSATQGEKFNVYVDIKTTTYSNATELGSDKKVNVLSANSVKLPKIEDIDTMSQAVLSSAKELNKYDKEALNYFNQKIADYDPSLHSAALYTKTIDIVKENAPIYNGVTVKATVTYEDKIGVTPAGNKYVKDIYAGTFVEPLNDDGVTFAPIDSNIYIFYKNPVDTGLTVDKYYINIIDKSTYPAGTTHASHKVYFIRQDIGVTQGPTINFYEGVPTTPTPSPTPTPVTFSYSGVSELDDDGGKDYYNIRFITNLDNTNISNEGHVYNKEARNRVYDITVVLKKGSPEETYATLNSTKSASDEP